MLLNHLRLLMGRVATGKLPQHCRSGCNGCTNWSEEIEEILYDPNAWGLLMWICMITSLQLPELGSS